MNAVGRRVEQMQRLSDYAVNEYSLAKISNVRF